MAKLEIKLKDPKRKRIAYTISDYDILIDGYEPTAIIDFKLEMGVGDLNKVTLSFYCENIDIDADTMLSLQAIVDKK